MSSPHDPPLRRARRLSAALALTLAVGLAPACGDPAATTETGSESETASDAPIDEAMVIAEVLAFDQGGYTMVNAAPLTSQHAAAEVDVWVADDVVDLYRLIDPADPGSSVTFPSGAILIKHHWTAEGASDGWTVMVKGPEGYDPDALGWWWARILGDGSAAAKGNVDFCVTCHMSSATTDYVRGFDPALLVP